MLSGDSILLDACVLINLEATGRLDVIARVLGLDLLVTEPACAEVGGLRAEIDGVIKVVPIQLERHITSGTLTVVPLKSEELSAYVELARELGDGEASSIAVAASRSLVIATDDRKARRISAERGLSEPTRTTRILRDYCDRARCESPVVRDLLRAVQQRANFVPARSDPGHDWWRTHLGP